MVKNKTNTALFLSLSGTQGRILSHFLHKQWEEEGSGAESMQNGHFPGTGHLASKEAKWGHSASRTPCLHTSVALRWRSVGNQLSKHKNKVGRCLPSPVVLPVWQLLNGRSPQSSGVNSAHHPPHPPLKLIHNHPLSLPWPCRNQCVWQLNIKQVNPRPCPRENNLWSRP